MFCDMSGYAFLSETLGPEEAYAIMDQVYEILIHNHGLHWISNRKLSALAAVHNFFIRRRDGTTAAERFFGNKPKAMFEVLLNNIDLPGRPARRRL
jgi:class 3 adenylate cyclase